MPRWIQAIIHPFPRIYPPGTNFWLPVFFLLLCPNLVHAAASFSDGLADTFTANSSGLNVTLSTEITTVQGCPNEFAPWFAWYIQGDAGNFWSSPTSTFATPGTFSQTFQLPAGNYQSIFLACLQKINGEFQLPGVQAFATGNITLFTLGTPEGFDNFTDDIGSGLEFHYVASSGRFAAVWNRGGGSPCGGGSCESSSWDWTPTEAGTITGIEMPLVRVGTGQSPNDNPPRLCIDVNGGTPTCDDADVAEINTPISVFSPGPVAAVADDVQTYDFSTGITYDAGDTISFLWDTHNITTPQNTTDFYMGALSLTHSENSQLSNLQHQGNGDGTLDGYPTFKTVSGGSSGDQGLSEEFFFATSSQVFNTGFTTSTGALCDEFGRQLSGFTNGFTGGGFGGGGGGSWGDTMNPTPPVGGLGGSLADCSFDIVRVLFYPNASTWNNIYQLGNTLVTKVPFGYVAQLRGVFQSNDFSGISTTSTDISMTLIPNASNGYVTTTVKVFNFNEVRTRAEGAAAILRTVLAAIFWFLFGWWAYNLGMRAATQLN